MKKTYSKLCLIVLLSVLFVKVSAQVKDLNYFRNKIQSAYDAQESSVTLDEGTFYLDYTSGGEFFEFSGMFNFTINAYNTRFIFTSGERAFTFNNCKNLKIKGLTIDYWPLPFTQGTVSAKDGAIVTVDIHEGYAGKDEGMTNTFRKSANFIEPDSKSLKADVFPTGNLSENWINDRQVNITLTKNKNINNVAVNDRIVLFYDSYGGSGHTFFINGCADLALADLTINSSIGRAFLETTGGGNTLYDNVQVTYGDKPVGASEPRLFTSVAAGIRTIGLTKGPQITNSVFEGLGDDGCNIQGDYFLVFETGTNYINIASKRSQYFEPGDTIVCTNRQGVEVGMAKIQSISEAEKPSDFDSKRADYLAGTSYENKNSTFINYYRFNFDGTLNAEESYYVYNRNKVGAGCRIENTTYRNIRARGIIVKAPYASIINNNIESITGAGIMIVPEVVFWLESGPSRNLAITGNTVRNTNRRPEILNGTQSAGIVVSCEGEAAGGNKIFTPGIIHSNISISENTFEDTPGPGLVVSSTRNIEISGNQFKNTNNASGWQGGVNVGVDVGAAFYITQSERVFICENEVISQGVNGTSPSTLSTTVTNIFTDCEDFSFTSNNEQNVDNTQVLSCVAYPNPFDQHVNIKLNLKESGNYILNIYDTAGRKIEFLFYGYIPEGETTFNWSLDCPDSNQIYICVLENNVTKELDFMRLINLTGDP